MNVSALTVAKMCAERESCEGCIYKGYVCEDIMSQMDKPVTFVPEDIYKLSTRKYSIPDKVKEVGIIYHALIDKIEKIDIGDWIDLRSAENLKLKAGDYYSIDLGISMKLPEGYEAIVAPRSSLFAHKGLIQANSIGIIDNSYSGDDDIWHMPVYATRDCNVAFNERICQFRIQKKQPPINFQEVTTLGGNNRGGLGSTGGYKDENR